MKPKLRKRARTGHIILCPVLFMLMFCWLFAKAGIGICDIDDDYIRLGTERMQDQRYREAIVYFEAARSSDPDDKNIRKNLAYAYHSLAIEYSMEHDWYRAIQNEKLALENDPGNDKPD